MLRNRATGDGKNKTIPLPLDSSSVPQDAASAHSRVGRNILTTLLAQVLSWGMTFAVTLVLPRAIGDGGLGEWTLAGSFAVLFSLVAGLGTSTVLIRDIARKPDKAGEWASAALLLRVPLCVAAMGAGYLLARGLGYDTARCAAIVAALGVMALAQIGDVFGCVLRGLELIPRQNAATLLEKVITSGLTVWLALRFHQGQPLWPLLAVGAWGAAAGAGFSVWALRGRMRLAMPVRADVNELFRAGLPFLSIAVFVAVYGQADAVLLSKMSTTAAIGWYGLAKRLGGSTLVIPVALCSAMLPTLSRLYAQDQKQFLSAVRRLFHLVLIGVVPFVAILTLAPGQVLAILHYPPAFRHAVPVLILMGGGVVLWFLSQVAGTALIASDRQAAASRAAALSALFCVPLCAGCIFVAERGMGNGAVGAMASDLLLEAGMLALYMRALPPGLLGRESLSVLARATLAALPLVALFYGVHSRAALLLCVPGLALYGPLCVWLRCLSPSDVAALRGVFLRKAGA